MLPHRNEHSAKVGHSGQIYDVILARHIKCLQDSFEHQGDALYEELKHVRNALEGLWGTLRFSEAIAQQSRQVFRTSLRS